MGSREKILADVIKNQPANSVLPGMIAYAQSFPDLTAKFMELLRTIGAEVMLIDSVETFQSAILQIGAGLRIVSVLPELAGIAEGPTLYDDPHALENVELAVVKAHFGVAENGSVWVTEDLLPNRVIPFICQQLAVVVHSKDILPTMFEAYDRIGAAMYGFGTFIAGPSKTADIEQSLVMGAHGPVKMYVFIFSS